MTKANSSSNRSRREIECIEVGKKQHIKISHM